MTAEQTLQSAIRAEASRAGLKLWRNNNGVLPDQRGVPVRFGLGNDSSRLNKVLKSSDLIGITPVTIPQEWVGCMVGVFTAVEVKPGGWKGVRTDRERAQEAFINLVRERGGFAGFAQDMTDFHNIIGVR